MSKQNPNDPYLGGELAQIYHQLPHIKQLPINYAFSRCLNKVNNSNFYSIRCYNGHARGTWFTLKHQPSGEIVGSCKDKSTIFIDDASLSKRHALIRFSSRSAVYKLSDLSYNSGTWIKLHPYFPRRIYGDQNIQLDKILLKASLGTPLSPMEAFLEFLDVFKLQKYSEEIINSLKLDPSKGPYIEQLLEKKKLTHVLKIQITDKVKLHSALEKLSNYIPSQTKSRPLLLKNTFTDEIVAEIRWTGAKLRCKTETDFLNPAVRSMNSTDYTPSHASKQNSGNGYSLERYTYKNKHNPNGNIISDNSRTDIIYIDSNEKENTAQSYKNKYQANHRNTPRLANIPNRFQSINKPNSNANSQSPPSASLQSINKESLNHSQNIDMNDDLEAVVEATSEVTTSPSWKTSLNNFVRPRNISLYTKITSKLQNSSSPKNEVSNNLSALSNSSQSGNILEKEYRITASSESSFSHEHNTNDPTLLSSEYISNDSGKGTNLNDCSNHQREVSQLDSESQISIETDYYSVLSCSFPSNQNLTHPQLESQLSANSPKSYNTHTELNTIISNTSIQDGKPHILHDHDHSENTLKSPESIVKAPSPPSPKQESSVKVDFSPRKQNFSKINNFAAATSPSLCQIDTSSKESQKNDIEFQEINPKRSTSSSNSPLHRSLSEIPSPSNSNIKQENMSEYSSLVSYNSIPLEHVNQELSNCFPLPEDCLSSLEIRFIDGFYELSIIPPDFVIIDDLNYWLSVTPSESYNLHAGDFLRFGDVTVEVYRQLSAIISVRGRRPTMEDEEIAIHDFGLFQDLNSSFFAVFDGHGGTSCAKFTRSNLPQQLKKNLKQLSGEFTPMASKITHDNIYRSIFESFLTVDNEFLKIPLSSDNSGCTAIVVLLLGSTLWCANCGDARALLCRNGHPIRLSIDHKPDRVDEHHRINRAGGFVKDKRILGRLAVSRAFGDLEYKNIKQPINSNIDNNDYRHLESISAVIVDPEIRYIQLRNEDEFLIIACDGLFDVFSSHELISFIRSRINGKSTDPNIIARELVNEAIKRNTKDNITVIIVMLN